MKEEGRREREGEERYVMFIFESSRSNAVEGDGSRCAPIANDPRTTRPIRGEGSIYGEELAGAGCQ